MLALLAFGIGVVAGLRSMTAPAIVSWMAHLHGDRLQPSRFGFMASTPALVVFTLGAIAELVADKLPKTPNRTAPVPLAARILMGGLCGAALCAFRGGSATVGAVAGALGGVAGAFGGYQVRKRAVQGLHVPDFAIAASEDVVAVVAAILLSSQG
jgi:uncharacterized membrane protein